MQARFDRPLWRRSIALRPGGDWRVWQLSDVSNVDGVGGPDLNPAGAVTVLPGDVGVDHGGSVRQRPGGGKSDSV